MGPRCWEVAVQELRPVPEVAVTVSSTPDDRCCDIWNILSEFAVSKYLHNVASSWVLLKKKLDKMQEFKRRLKYFLMQHTFYSMNEYISS